jgi:hypothetical protein
MTYISGHDGRRTLLFELRNSTAEASDGVGPSRRHPGEEFVHGDESELEKQQHRLR